MNVFPCSWLDYEKVGQRLSYWQIATTILRIRSWLICSIFLMGQELVLVEFPQINLIFDYLHNQFISKQKILLNTLFYSMTYHHFFFIYIAARGSTPKLDNLFRHSSSRRSEATILRRRHDPPPSGHFHWWTSGGRPYWTTPEGTRILWRFLWRVH